MAFIGNTVQTQGFTPAIDYFNGNGVTVTFTLSRPVASVAQMIVAVDNVIQNPSSAFNVSGSSITFTSAPLSGTNNIWVEYTSLITTYNAISQDPTVIGDIRATGGYLAEGDFGNSYVDGTIVDYVTGNARITTGPADGLTIYNGGTTSRTALAAWDASGNLTNTGAIITPTMTSPTISSGPLTIGTTALGAGNASIMKNRIINGAMVINQRGFSGTPANGAYTLDRYNVLMPVASKFTVAQSSTAPTGFVNSLLVTSSSAYTVGASEGFGIQQVIEGYNIADLMWGTANAKTVTLSFWVYSSLTGTFGGALQNYASDRSYPFSYTVSSANTWTQASITIAGDTTGTWTTTNSGGIALIFSMGTGSTKSGTAGSWSSTYYTSVTGATSVVGTNGATFYITGVQLEVGSSATGFEYVNYQTSLANCQRYFWRKSGSSSVVTVGSGMAYNTTDIRCTLVNPVIMRTTPTIAFTGSNFEYEKAASARGTLSSIDSAYRSPEASMLYSGAGTTATTAGQGAIWYITDSASYIFISAEL